MELIVRQQLSRRIVKKKKTIYVFLVGFFAPATIARDDRLFMYAPYGRENKRRIFTTGTSATSCDTRVPGSGRSHKFTARWRSADSGDTYCIQVYSILLYAREGGEHCCSTHVPSGRWDLIRIAFTITNHFLFLVFFSLLWNRTIRLDFRARLPKAFSPRRAWHAVSY